jgi:hypothetical protein
MSPKHLFKSISRFTWVLVVPASILVSSALLPLQPFVRQAMIGILLIWFQVSLMLGLFRT